MKGKLRLLALLITGLLPGWIKLPIYRWLFGAKIAAGVRIGFATLLIFDQLTLDAGVRIGSFNIIRVSTLKVGKRGRIGSCTRVTCHTVELGSASTLASWVSVLADHRDPQSVFKAGAESWIFDYCYINPARPIILGRNVGVGGGSYLFTHGFWLSKLKGFPVAYGSITIHDDVWLPWGCFIMPGVDIGSGAVVGARSVVTKSLPAGVLAAGMPAKVLRDTAAAPMTLDAQNAILIEATQEFARMKRANLETRQSGEWTECVLDGEPLFSLANAERPTTYPEAHGRELCVVHDAYGASKGRHPRLYSLASYQCCDYASLGTVQLAWLNHLRLIGVRFYPIDEIVVE